MSQELPENELLRLRKRVQILTDEKLDLVDMVHDMFIQACSCHDPKYPNFKYDHCCLSTYEHAQRFLIECGRIKAEECSRH